MADYPEAPAWGQPGLQGGENVTTMGRAMEAHDDKPAAASSGEARRMPM